MANRQFNFNLLKAAFLAAILALFFLFAAPSQADIQPYYSGDAINYNGQIVVGSADSGYLEIFKLEGDSLHRIIKVKNYNQTFNTSENYSDVRFSQEGGRLYVYAISQYSVFKYDFSDLNSLVLVAKNRNTYWDWYERLDVFGDRLGTASRHGVKIMNSSLEVIESNGFSPSNRYGVTGGDSRQLIFGFDDSRLQAFDRGSQSVIREIPLEFLYDNENHQAYFDAAASQIYVADDYHFKKYSLTGELLASFKHLEAPGYDAAGLLGSDAVYFSNGYGVVKFSRGDFKLKDYVFTTTIGAPQGWAMGLKLLSSDKGEMLVVFNASNILVLDKNLDKVASVRAEAQSAPQSQESLFLGLSHTFGSPGAEINLWGGGYWPDENLSVSLAGQALVNVQADRQGRFNLKLTIPELNAQRTDIKVSGLNSGLHYSIAFEVQ